MKTTAHTLEKLDTALDEVEELLRELPLTIRQEARLIDMLYDMYETAESSLTFEERDAQRAEYPQMMNDQQDAVN